MAHGLRDLAARKDGFTLVELLVVMLILGLLAAIAIPSFFNQRDKAKDTDAKSALRTAQTAAETLAVNNGAVYTGTGGVTVANLRVVEPSLNEADLSIPALAATSYTIRVTSSSGNLFDITRAATGAVTRPCATAGKGGCPSDGSWD